MKPSSIHTRGKKHVERDGCNFVSPQTCVKALDGYGEVKSWTQFVGSRLTYFSVLYLYPASEETAAKPNIFNTKEDIGDNGDWTCLYKTVNNISNKIIGKVLCVNQMHS